MEEMMNEIAKMSHEQLKKELKEYRSLSISLVIYAVLVTIAAVVMFALLVLWAC